MLSSPSLWVNEYTPLYPPNWFSSTQGFVIYIPIGPYLTLQLLFGGLHTFVTVVGIYNLQTPPIHLESEIAEGGPIVNGKSESFRPIIPPPDRHTIIRLGIIAAVVSLSASLPLNFAPKYPLY